MSAMENAFSRWFVFRGGELLVRKSGAEINIPCSADIAVLKQELRRTQYVGTFNGGHCSVAEADMGLRVPGGMYFQDLRSLLGLLDEGLFSLAGRAFQILHWDRTHLFCGRCGNKTEEKRDERAKECPQCGLVIYPEVSPAIIVAVIKSREILLARSQRFKGTFHSVLAGFVEPGETFEECVKREVKEEVGIDTGNIRYFGSQPWPFPHSLMVGFTADYAGGEIRVDESEIIEAGWFGADALPPIPRTGTIARQLIDWFVARSSKRS